MPIDLQYFDDSFGTLWLQPSSATPALSGGAFILYLNLDLKARPAGETVSVVLLGGSLRCGALHVAQVPTVAGNWSTGPHPSTGLQIDCEVPITFESLAALDRSRDASGALELTLRAFAAVHGPRGAQCCRGNIPIAINETEWFRLLKAMSFEERVSFSVAVRGGTMDRAPFDGASSFYRDALGERDRRKWHQAIGQCREVFDALKKAGLFKEPRHQAPKADDWSKKQIDPTTNKPTNKPVNQAWDVSKRIAFIREAVNHAANAGHHRGVGDPSPKEARLIVAMTGLLLEYLGSDD